MGACQVQRWCFQGRRWGRRVLGVDPTLLQNPHEFIADFETLLGLGLVPHLFFQEAQVVPCHGVLGVQLDGALVIGNGARGVASGLLHPSTRGIPVTVLGLQGCRQVQPFEGLSGFFAMKVTDRPVVHGIGILRGFLGVGRPPQFPKAQGFGPISGRHGQSGLGLGLGVVSVGVVRSFHGGCV